MSGNDLGTTGSTPEPNNADTSQQDPDRPTDGSPTWPDYVNAVIGRALAQMNLTVPTLAERIVEQPLPDSAQMISDLRRVGRFAKQRVEYRDRLRTRDAHDPIMSTLTVLTVQVLLQLETPIIEIDSSFRPAADNLPAMSTRIFHTAAARLEVSTFDGHCTFEYTQLNPNGERTSEPLFMSCKLDSNGKLNAPPFEPGNIVHRIREGIR